MLRPLSPSTAALLLLPPLLWAGNAVVGRALVGEFPPLALEMNARQASIGNVRLGKVRAQIPDLGSCR